MQSLHQQSRQKAVAQAVYSPFDNSIHSGELMALCAHLQRRMASQVHPSAVPGPAAAGGPAAGAGHLVALVLPVLRVALPDAAPSGALG